MVQEMGNSGDGVFRSWEVEEIGSSCVGDFTTWRAQELGSLANGESRRWGVSRGEFRRCWVKEMRSSLHQELGSLADGC